MDTLTRLKSLFLLASNGLSLELEDLIFVLKAPLEVKSFLESVYQFHKAHGTPFILNASTQVEGDEIIEYVAILLEMYDNTEHHFGYLTGEGDDFAWALTSLYANDILLTVNFRVVDASLPEKTFAPQYIFTVRDDYQVVLGFPHQLTRNKKTMELNAQGLPAFLVMELDLPKIVQIQHGYYDESYGYTADNQCWRFLTNTDESSLPAYFTAIKNGKLEAYFAYGAAMNGFDEEEGREFAPPAGMFGIYFRGDDEALQRYHRFHRNVNDLLKPYLKSVNRFWL